MKEAVRSRYLLIILYLSFISLGLPDAVLGVAWPEMRLSFEKPLEFAGFLLSMTTILSVCSSLSTGFFTSRWSTGALIALCAMLTAGAMFGYAFSGNIASLAAFTVFFGLGQGAVDTAVNAYMSRRYSSRHMNWIHCCWGIGATGGPLIITGAFAMNFSWRAGYLAIGTVQAGLALVFLLSLKLWKDGERQADEETGQKAGQPPARELPRRKLLAAALSGMGFYFLYPGIELVAGLWGASYLVERLGASPASAGMSITMFWACLALGRFLAGFPAERWSNAAIIRAGLFTAALGGAALLFSGNLFVCRAGLMLLGLGIAPLYPSMMHDTPGRIGGRHADRVIGFQVGAALAGGTLIPAAVGLLAGHSSLGKAFPPVLCLFICLVLIAHEISLRNSLWRGAE